MTKFIGAKDADIISPPVAEIIPKELEIHGDVRIDNYYWMNDRDDPKVIEHLRRENQYTDKILSHTKDFQAQLFEEIIGRIKKDDLSVPYFSNEYYYLTKYQSGKEYPIYLRKKTLESPQEELLIDVNELASDHPYYHVGALSISPNNEILAYSEDTISRRIYTIRFKNLKTGLTYPDEIKGTGGNVVWADDNQTIFYTQRDKETLRTDKVFRHKIGESIDKDKMVYLEKDETFITYIYKTTSKKYIVIGSYANKTQEFRILQTNKPDGNFSTFSKRKRGIEYSIDHFENSFYIRTNWEAENFKLMTSSEKETGRSFWKEYIPHDPEVLIEDFDLFKKYIVISERALGNTQLRIINNSTNKSHVIDFGEESYFASTSINREADTQFLRLSYTSLTTPSSTFDYDMENKILNLKKQQEIVGGYNSEEYESKRLMALSHDNIRIPVSLVYKKSLFKAGHNPCLLYGYGSYGHSIDPYFSSVRLSLLDRGFVFAIAHVRGGEELGRKWYTTGKMLNKKNTFLDFINCGEHLINQKYCKNDGLFAMGGSAGGLLVGAVLNMRPKLWAGAIAAVPFVDVITTMQDESIPLTTGEYDEWGNPNDEEYYYYIKSYSPYDNVSTQEYPNLLVTTGLHDSQVQYWEPAKWVAKLREIKKDNNSLLLYTNLDAGHGGASGRFKRHKETALEYAFLLNLIGITS